MNRTEQQLFQLWEQAKQQPDLRLRLLATQNEKEPMDSFCHICQEVGYDIQLGDLFALGQENSDNQCKSTNGGNPSPYESFSDAYENFLASLKE